MGLLDMTWAERHARYEAMKREHDALLIEIEERHRKEREGLIARRSHLNREYVSLSDACPHPVEHVTTSMASGEPYCRFCNNVLRSFDPVTAPVEAPERVVVFAKAA